MRRRRRAAALGAGLKVGRGGGQNDGDFFRFKGQGPPEPLRTQRARHKRPLSTRGSERRVSRSQDKKGRKKHNSNSTLERKAKKNSKGCLKKKGTRELI
jgi:hypothetical protein